MNIQKRAGFTLVELLTVIAIIALLAALILGLAGNAQKKAARDKTTAEVTQLSSFVGDYLAQYGQVPKNTAALSNELKAVNHALTNMLDPWGMTYRYEASSPVTFYLWSLGGDLGSPATNRALWIGTMP